MSFNIDGKNHISQVFGLPEEADLDFLDANLAFDTPTFIDPFLLKNSPIFEEAELFERFGDFFRYAYEKSFELSIGEKNVRKFKSLLSFKEPRSIYMGYTEASNKGKGARISERLLHFFLDNSAKKFIKDTKYFPDHQYNPVSMQIFTDKMGPDGISDITANLIMDYLIKYTQEQSRKWGIKMKPRIRLETDGFDFIEQQWKGGGYYELPENPLSPGDPIVFVPMRLLRGLEEYTENPTSRVFSILRADSELSIKFSDLLEKTIKDVSIEEIRNVFLESGTVHFRYLQSLEQASIRPYDFKQDILGLLADKNYSGRFSDYAYQEVSNCEELRLRTEELIDIFRDEFEKRDGWKDAWKPVKKEYLVSGYKKQIYYPLTEPVIGRKLRAMGYAFFSHYNDVTFLPEATTSNGLVDFHVIYKDCRILIEFKLLSNSINTGKPPKLPAYVHGIRRQLPHYVDLVKAKHAYYITGQHFDGNVKNSDVDHSSRILELRNLVPEIQKDITVVFPNFISLNYKNIKMMPRPSASKL